MRDIIHLKAIRKLYQLGKVQVKALRSVSLDINENEYVAIMGPSGSGKSTLMNIIGCLDTPTSGSYVLNGTDVGQLTDNELARIRNKEVGFIFQMFNLLPRQTALENVALPLVYAGTRRSDRLQKANALLDLVGLSDRTDHRPNELSGGQQQRVAIARALINDPAIILADEPTGNLDSTSSGDIMDLFGRIHAQGNTVILVTHEADIAQHAHRIIRLMDGKIESDVKNEHIIEVK